MINFKIHTLKNGIRVVTAPMSSTEATAIQIQVGIGTRFETKEKNGISHFLEHV
ncbi:insulinase family protein, partial [Patescibacteria group bacterium]|nr:insulinase family protein [Patescibacteria group bacterium]